MKEHTSIAVVLDRSGSMWPVVDDTIGGFNRFLGEQAKVEGSADISLHQFDNKYETVYSHIPVKEAKPLDDKTYVPRGSTALLDAIGNTIHSMGKKLEALPENDRPNKVMVVIITDGYENSSREFSHNQIRELIKQQEDVYSWEFVYLGATLDAVSIATNLGFKGGSSASYSGDKTSGVFDMLSSKITSYRSMSDSTAKELKSGQVDLFTQEDRKEIS